MQECARLEAQRQRQEVPRQEHCSLRCGGLVQLKARKYCRQPRLCADKRRAVGVLLAWRQWLKVSARCKPRLTAARQPSAERSTSVPQERARLEEERRRREARALL